MPPSLKDAYARLRRADAHLEELSGLVESFRQQNTNPVSAKVWGDPPEQVRLDALRDGRRTIGGVTLEVLHHELPDGIEAVLGDLVQNCRIPLDYLVYQLAWLDSGFEQEGTQFPILWGNKAFNGKKSSYLRGVNGAHRHAIRLLQPDKGGKWLGDLAGLSNPDKHRKLLDVVNATDLVVNSRVEKAPHDPSRRDMKMEFRFTPTIALPNRQRVVEGMSVILTGVRAIMDEFDPCFRSECPHEEPPRMPPSPRKRAR